MGSSKNTTNSSNDQTTIDINDTFTSSVLDSFNSTVSQTFAKEENLNYTSDSNNTFSEDNRDFSQDLDFNLSVQNSTLDGLELPEISGASPSDTETISETGDGFNLNKALPYIGVGFVVYLIVTNI